MVNQPQQTAANWARRREKKRRRIALKKIGVLPSWYRSASQRSGILTKPVCSADDC
jgi:hypothetical protein